MTENSKEKQNEIDAEQALKDFLKELVLIPLEDQQSKFLPKLKNTIQDSISESVDISETKNTVGGIKIVTEKTKSSVEALSSALEVISKTLEKSKDEINILKSTSDGLSTKLDEFNITQDKINNRHSTLSTEILKHYRLGVYFSIALSLLLLAILILVIIK